MSKAIDRLRIRHLRLLTLVDGAGSLRAVADTLHLTQPAVTQMVHDLEAAFGATLIARSSRGASLTEAGRTALQRLDAGLATLDLLAGALRTSPSPLLRVGLMPIVAVDLLPRAIHRLAPQQSGLRLELHEGTVPEILHALLSGRVDCCIGRIDWPSVDRDRVDDIVAEPVGASALQIACAPDHPLFDARRRRAADLLAHPWILPPEHTLTRAAVDAAFRDRGLVPPVPSIVSGSFHSNLHLASQAPLLTAAPRAAVAHAARHDLVRELRVADFVLPEAALEFASLRALQAMPAVAALRAAVRATAAADTRRVPGRPVRATAVSAERGSGTDAAQRRRPRSSP